MSEEFIAPFSNAAITGNDSEFESAEGVESGGVVVAQVAPHVRGGVQFGLDGGEALIEDVETGGGVFVPIAPHVRGGVQFGLGSGYSLIDVGKAGLVQSQT